MARLGIVVRCSGDLLLVSLINQLWCHFSWTLKSVVKHRACTWRPWIMIATVGCSQRIVYYIVFPSPHSHPSHCFINLPHYFSWKVNEAIYTLIRSPYKPSHISNHEVIINGLWLSQVGSNHQEHAYIFMCTFIREPFNW